MLRNFGAIVLGYVVMFVVIFATFSIAYLILGPDRAFAPGSYEISASWLVLSIVLSFLAAVAGGYVCTVIGRGSWAPYGLAVIVGVLGLLSAVPAFTAEPPPASRSAAVSTVDAMQNAREPRWLAIGYPVIGVIGVLVGGSGRLNRRRG